MYYFAYGSNLSTRRMLARIPDARFIGTGMIRGHQLRFHKIGLDGSAKCDALDTGHPEHVLHGAIYHIDADKITQLDHYEGAGQGYEKRHIKIIDQQGKYFDGFLYFATSIDCSLKPFDWYKQHVVNGSREHGFKAEYVADIIAVESISDPNTERSKTEFALYST